MAVLTSKEFEGTNLPEIEFDSNERLNFFNTSTNVGRLFKSSSHNFVHYRLESKYFEKIIIR